MMAPRGVREAGREGRRLAEVAAEPDHAQPRIGGVQLGQDLEAVVAAAVVDRDDLVGPPPRLQRRRQLGVELANVRRLVVDGDDDG